MGSIAVDARVLRQLVAVARAALPEECCGLLLGGMAGQGRRITALLPARNVATARTRAFAIDPAVLIAAQKAARGGGPAVLGAYHSHPGGDPTPSAADLAQARGAGAIWAIIACGVAGDAADSRAGWRIGWWCDADEGVTPLSLTGRGG